MWEYDNEEQYEKERKELYNYYLEKTLYNFMILGILLMILIMIIGR